MKTILCFLFISATALMPLSAASRKSDQGSLTNQLANTDQPLTTAPSYQNPRLTDLLYGSNLLVDEQETNRDGKAEKADDIEFGERGIFDTAPHCKKGYILVLITTNQSLLKAHL